MINDSDLRVLDLRLDFAVVEFAGLCVLQLVDLVALEEHYSRVHVAPIQTVSDDQLDNWVRSARELVAVQLPAVYDIPLNFCPTFRYCRLSIVCLYFQHDPVAESAVLWLVVGRLGQDSGRQSKIANQCNHNFTTKQLVNLLDLCFYAYFWLTEYHVRCHPIERNQLVFAHI